jgi:hypothetical protein
MLSYYSLILNFGYSILPENLVSFVNLNCDHFITPVGLKEILVSCSADNRMAMIKVKHGELQDTY